MLTRGESFRSILHERVALHSGQDGWGTRTTLALPPFKREELLCDRSLGEVASSSGVQQAREQKCSAGRQLGGGDDDFDY